MDRETSGEILKIRTDTADTLRRGAYFWLIMVMTSVLGSAGAILVSVLNTQRSERKLCSVIIQTDDYYRQAPPTTPAGKKQAANFSQLRQSLGCPPHKEQR